MLDSIDIFVEVVNAQSFSRAAERLGMPPTTVSARIKRLEQRLGTTLLQRTTRRLSLTDTGERYFSHCAKAIEQVQQAERAVATTREEPRGRLRITAPADLVQSALSPTIKSYLTRYPGVTVELIVSNDYRDLVGEGIDLAVRVGELRNSSLIVRSFFTSAAGLWAAPSYLAEHPPIRALQDLVKLNLIRVQAGKRSLTLKDGQARLDLDSVPSNVRANDMGTCQTLAESGLGIALLPLFIQADANKARLVRVLPRVQTGNFTVNFLYPRQNLVPPTLRHFMELALKTVRV